MSGALIRGLILALVALAGQDEFSGVERIVAVGDVHGDYEQFVAVLRSAELIDEQGKWSGGKTQLVQTGDLLDRGPDSRKAMDLLMRLEDESKAAGGAVHALIGNHEAMNVYGDLRYVSEGEYAAFRTPNSEKYRDLLFREHEKELRASGVTQKLDEAYRKSWDAEHPLGWVEHRGEFGPAGKYGKWIRGHQAVIRIDATLFLHGGISPKYADYGLRRLNDQIRADLDDPKIGEKGVARDEQGPLWYRGLAQGDENALERGLETILKNYKVKRLVLGHTYTEGAIIPRFGGKVLLIDVGLCRLYDPALRKACLVIEKGNPVALHRGKRVELPLDSRADLLRYYKQAAALDPLPSPLRGKISELESRK